ncbi:MAG: hypothetical protein WAN72_03635 [Candidatus Acidiferrales bacterium]
MSRFEFGRGVERHIGAEEILTSGHAVAQQAAPLPTWFTVRTYSVEPWSAGVLLELRRNGGSQGSAD